MTTKPRFAFVLEYVSDIEEAKRFYIDVLGLEVERESPEFVQFKDETETGAHFAIASDAPMSASGEPELYWVVDDAEAAFKDLSGRGKISRPLEQMPFGKVFALNDPAGRPRYLVEFAQERPSQRAD